MKLENKIDPYKTYFTLLLKHSIQTPSLSFEKFRMFLHLKKIFLLCLLFLAPSCALNLKAEPEIYFRFNQIGFLPNDLKTAIVLSYNKLDGKQVAVFNLKTKERIFTSYFGSSLGVYGNFPFSYSIDFSKIKSSGEYYFQYAQQKTFSFKIGSNVYNGLADSLLQFFKVQRCGYTEPLLHKVCHISDVSNLVDGKRSFSKKIDVTGGWHDAGDYVKFLNTTSFATYMLLFSYDFDPVKFGFDNNKNGTPDVLEEAKIGLDWMLRCLINKNRFVTQVQDLRDHNVGWRLPEDDPLGFDRPAYIGIGKNLIGIYAATLALASRIWNEKFHYPEFSNQCLEAAQKIYSIRNNVADIDSSGSGFYLDKTFKGKLALGAAELYMATNKSSYLNDASIYADSAGADYWWSWGDCNSLAHYRIAKFIPRYTNYISQSLEFFNKKKNENQFGKVVTSTWGTNVTLLGVALQNILYQKLTNDYKYDSVAVFQRDYILGRNSWGVSFIKGVGKNSVKNLHHQVGYLTGKLPGGFAAGPVTKEFAEKSKISYDKFDKYEKFQTKEAYYRDDRNDYISNEPTITGNATAIFVLGNFSSKK